MENLIGGECENMEEEAIRCINCNFAVWKGTSEGYCIDCQRKRVFNTLRLFMPEEVRPLEKLK